MSMTGSPATAQRVVLHIGTPKSGTTFLQRALWRHREQLDAMGVTCAGDQPLRDVPRGDRAARAPYAFWGRDKEELAGTWQRLCDAGPRLPRHHDHEPRAARARRRASRSTPGAGRARGLEVHLVYTARDLARQVASEWQERVKNGNPVTLRGLLRGRSALERHERRFWRNQHLIGVLDRWARDVPPEQRARRRRPAAGRGARRAVAAVRRRCRLRRRAILDPTVEEPTANQTLGAVQVAAAAPGQRGARRPDPAARLRQGRQAASSPSGSWPARTRRRPSARRSSSSELAQIATRQNEPRSRERGYQVHGDLAELVPPARGRTVAGPRHGRPRRWRPAAAVAAIAEPCVEKAAPGAGAPTPAWCRPPVASAAAVAVASRRIRG